MCHWAQPARSERSTGARLRLNLMEKRAPPLMPDLAEVGVLVARNDPAHRD
jgi:hypothetical protein